MCVCIIILMLECYTLGIHAVAIVHAYVYVDLLAYVGIQYIKSKIINGMAGQMACAYNMMHTCNSIELIIS